MNRRHPLYLFGCADDIVTALDKLTRLDPEKYGNLHAAACDIAVYFSELADDALVREFQA